MKKEMKLPQHVQAVVVGHLKIIPDVNLNEFAVNYVARPDAGLRQVVPAGEQVPLLTGATPNFQALRAGA